jgi:hypothetical protein
VNYFNTAFSLSMVKAPFRIVGNEFTIEQVQYWLRKDGNVINVANPTHANTLNAISQKIGIDVRDAKGGRVLMKRRDTCLVAQVSFPPEVPRETKEYTDEQIALGTFSFILVEVR